MREERKAGTSPSLRKLLRVLVAGGVALAGLAATRADEAQAPPPGQGTQPAEKPDQGKAAKEKQKDQKKKTGDKDKQKKGDDKKSEDPFGVRGW